MDPEDDEPMVARMKPLPEAPRPGSPARLEAVLEAYHQALVAFVQGDSEPIKALYSHAEDATIANPFGPPSRGWERAAATMDRAATNWHGGRATGFERVSGSASGDLAYIVEIERYEARIGGSPDLHDVSLRVTTVLRAEDGTWRVVHRHADPITSARSAEAIITG